MLGTGTIAPPATVNPNQVICIDMDIEAIHSRSSLAIA
jgi:hypothetical protein